MPTGYKILSYKEGKYTRFLEVSRSVVANHALPLGAVIYPLSYLIFAKELNRFFIAKQLKFKKLANCGPWDGQPLERLYIDRLVLARVWNRNQMT